MTKNIPHWGFLCSLIMQRHPPFSMKSSLRQRLKTFAHKDHPGLDFYSACTGHFETEGSITTLHLSLRPTVSTHCRRNVQYCQSFWLNQWCTTSSSLWIGYGVAHTSRCSKRNASFTLAACLFTTGQQIFQLKTVWCRLVTAITPWFLKRLKNDSSVLIIISDGDGSVTNIIYRFQSNANLWRVCMNNDWWMSDLYRDREVLLQLPWSYSVDVWSISVMVSLANAGWKWYEMNLLTEVLGYQTLKLLEGKNVFSLIDHVNRQYICTSIGFGAVHWISWSSSPSYHWEKPKTSILQYNSYASYSTLDYAQIVLHTRIPYFLLFSPVCPGNSQRNLSTTVSKKFIKLLTVILYSW